LKCQKTILKKPAKWQERKSKANFFKKKIEEKKSKNPGEGSKPLMQLKSHDDDNKPLPPLLVCRGWTASDSPLSVTLPLHLSLLLFFWLLLLSFSSATPHTQLKTKKEKKRYKKRKERKKQRCHRDLKQSYTKQKKYKKKRKTKEHRKKNEEISKKEKEIMNGKREGREEGREK